MTFEIAFVLGLIFLAFILFVTEKFSLDVTALLILTILLLGGFLSIDEAISGFSNPAVITISLLFILSYALQKTRILEYLIVRINQLVSPSKSLGLSVYLLPIALASALMNNTAIVAIFMPVTIRLAHRYHMSPSKLLIPLSYAAIMGGTLTLIGTSTNLLVNSIYIKNSGLALGMFEIAKYGWITLTLGLIYVLTIAPRILPSRTVTSSLTQSYHMAGYLTEMRLSTDSPLVGSTCEERSVSYNYDVIVLDIQRDDRLITYNVGNEKLQAGDILFVKGSVESFLQMKEVEKVSLLTDEKLTQSELEQEDNVLIECMVTDQSDLIGQTIMSSNFRKRFYAFILAIRREGGIIRKKVAHVLIQSYDTLLIYGGKKQLAKLANSSGFILLGEVQEKLVKVKFWWVSILSIIATIILAELVLLPIIKGALLSIVILLILRVITPNEAYQSIHWQVIILIAALIPLGTVIETTGTASFIGGSISQFVKLFSGNLQPYILLGLTYLITMILTEISSNTATAIIMTPIVLSLSANMGIDARPLIFSVCFAASASFSTPIGYQTNLMVYGAGGYKFSDFIKVGLPLSITFWLAAIIFIPMIWPF